MTTPLPIYSEHTVGRLLRRLNLQALKAVQSGDTDKASRAAAFSVTIEQALEFSELEEPANADGSGTR